MLGEHREGVPIVVEVQKADPIVGNQGSQLRGEVVEEAPGVEIALQGSSSSWSFGHRDSGPDPQFWVIIHQVRAEVVAHGTTPIECGGALRRVPAVPGRPRPRCRPWIDVLA